MSQQQTPRSGPIEPLGRVTSIKVKLGLLVAASVLVASVLATLGAGAVPAALSIPVTVLLALGVTQLLAVGMTSPLRQMTEAARRMAAGDYDVRVDTSSTDEVGELARTFNRMAADLATVDRQRRDLVASVSHELRTPLTALVAVLENLDDRVTEPDPATIRVALGQAQRLSNLVSDLLDLSRVDAGVVALDRGPVPVAALIGGAFTEARTGMRSVSFDVRVEPPGLVVDADRSRLPAAGQPARQRGPAQPRGRRRTRLAGRVGDVVRLEVTDDGAGIAPEDRERVFERFGTLQDPAGGGTGLGLAIARWVTDLHGGRFGLVDPVPGETGAASGSSFPRPSRRSRWPRLLQARQGEPGTETIRGCADVRVRGGGRSWTPDDVRGGRATDRGCSLRVALARTRAPCAADVLLACLGIGIFAGLSIPYVNAGLAVTLMLLASGLLVLWVSRHRGSPFTWACAALAAGFALLFVMRDADWILILGLLHERTAHHGGADERAVDRRDVAGRDLLAVRGAARHAVARSHDPGRRGRRQQRRGDPDRDPVRAGTAGLRAAVRDRRRDRRPLAQPGASRCRGRAGVARLRRRRGDRGRPRSGVPRLNPPALPSSGVRRPAQHRFEWLAPVLLVDAVFVLFLAAQTAVFFGGHDYIRSATGLTYAEYVHQGFGQLTFATALMLIVVWAASRKAGDTPSDKWWLRGSLGALCLLTLVVVASALYRIDLYQDAYGFTQMRLLVDLFEAWLGLVVVGVLVAGIRLRGWWLPRMALLSGAALLLGLALANPDAWIARHNIDRYEATGKVDWSYLRGLSADAAPTLAALPPEQAACALEDPSPEEGGWAGWNLSRQRAADALDDFELPTPRAAARSSQRLIDLR